MAKSLSQKYPLKTNSSTLPPLCSDPFDRRWSSSRLDSVVSAKIFDDIADGFESAANAVADVTTDIGEAPAGAYVCGQQVVSDADTLVWCVELGR